MDDAPEHRPTAGAPGVPRPVLRVAYAVEQCWHSVPGGTAVAALRVARELEARGDVDLHYVAGRHARPPRPEFRPRGPVAMLPVSGAVLYELWNRANWPRVESVVGEVDVVHATGLVPAGTAAPLVVTVHDIAFVHEPENFSRHGVRIMSRSLDTIRRRADRVICSSRATVDDLVGVGFEREVLRHVPLGVDPVTVSPSTVERVRRLYGLPDRFVLFVGTVEPRKNLARLAAAIEHRAGPEPLVVVGAEGWGDGGLDRRADVHFLGFVPERDLPAVYAAASVFAYPSLREGFGLPVAEAMAQGTPVVTSRGTSTEEVAGGAAVLVDPRDVEAIAAGVDAALDDSAVLADRGRQRAAGLTWTAAADATATVYRELAA